MSKKITIEVENEAIFKDPNYVPYISRSDARRKGIKRIVEPVHDMEPHIRAMLPSRPSPNNQIHIRNTNSPYNKKGRLVRREYGKVLKTSIIRNIKRFISDNNIKTKITKNTAKPGMVISHRLPEPIFRQGKIQRFIAMYLTNSMFKTVIKKSV